LAPFNKPVERRQEQVLTAGKGNCGCKPKSEKYLETSSLRFSEGFFYKTFLKKWLAETLKSSQSYDYHNYKSLK
jgi:hypothetical protein